MPSTPSKALRLGKTVTYRDRQGFEKAAMVVGTPESIRSDGMASRPAKGTAHLVVFSVTGQRYTRHDVPEGSGPGTFSR